MNDEVKKGDFVVLTDGRTLHVECVEIDRYSGEKWIWGTDDSGGEYEIHEECIDAICPTSSQKEQDEEQLKDAHPTALEEFGYSPDTIDVGPV